jgi:hypothetical protein
MLRKIENLPSNVIGIRAEGKVTKEDYESVIIPLLKEQHDQGNRVRFLYQMGSDFDEFTLGAAWDDFRIGLKYLRMFEMCAVVTDVDWISKASKVFGHLIPCPVKTFTNDQYKEAVKWLADPERSQP